MKDLNIFNHEFLYTAYADDTTFFLKDKISVFEILKNRFLKSVFSLVSGLSAEQSPNKVLTLQYMN